MQNMWEMSLKWSMKKTSVPGFAIRFLLIALTYTPHEQNVHSNATKTFNAIQTKVSWQSCLTLY